ncbi:MAG: KH domain-containing protein [SAR202 cluster bacterium]|nr:hypothetical protein [Chloroflexota bacterium]MQG88969.1 KH domain-containing protein [SAR202 cluster bacterium]
MTSRRKFSGKTVDDATEIALAALDVELEDVEIKVINTGRSGILGFGGESAEIEVSLLTSESTESGSDSFKARKSKRGNRGRGKQKRKARDNNSFGNKGSLEATQEQSPQDDDSDDAKSKRSLRKRRSTDHGRRGRARKTNQVDRSKTIERDDSDGQSVKYQRDQNVVHEKDKEAEQLVSELLDYFLGAMGVVADTYIRDDGDEGSLTFEIEGQDSGLLIGRRGETLQALQFILRMVTNRQLGRKASVVIDIEDYRERRVQMLRRIARRVAGRVASSGYEDSLEPMSPAERRIVHMALADHPEVHTESEGEGNQRRVVIFPNN